MVKKKSGEPPALNNDVEVVPATKEDVEKRTAKGAGGETPKADEYWIEDQIIPYCGLPNREGPPHQMLEISVHIPHRYQVWKDGLYRVKEMKTTVLDEKGAKIEPSLLRDAPKEYVKQCLEQIVDRPLFIAARGSRDGVDVAALTYDSGIEWRTRWLTVDQFSHSTQIVNLSKDSVPVHSGAAKDVSRFLAESYSLQSRLFPKPLFVVSRLGYYDLGGDSHGWLVGDTWIGTGQVLVDPTRTDIVKAVHTKGDEKAWIDEANKYIIKYESKMPDGSLADLSWEVRWLLGASFASPLLRFIRVNTLILHHFGLRKDGKTAWAKFAQSAWGNPRELMLSLQQTTENAALEIFSHVSDVPLLLDDTEGNEKNFDLKKFVMAVTSEKRKARVTRSGDLVEAVKRDWRLLVRTTGENILAGADSVDKGGQAARVVEINPPKIEGAALDIYHWNERNQHYGHAGLKFMNRFHAERLRDPEIEFAMALLKIIDGVTGSIAEEKTRMGQLSSIVLGEVLMLEWVFGWTREEALKTALDDMRQMAPYLRASADSSKSAGDKMIEMLQQHRIACPSLYVDMNTDPGRLLRGTGSKEPLLAIVHADKNEIWYFPKELQRLVKDRLDSGIAMPMRELTHKGIFDSEKSEDKGKGSTTVKRQNKELNLAATRYYVGSLSRIFDPQEEPQADKPLIKPSAVVEFDDSDAFYPDPEAVYEYDGYAPDYDFS